MIRFFQNIEIDRLSFWFGFFAGILFWWLLARIRLAYPRLREIARNQIQAARETLTASTEMRYRNDVVAWAQKQHIAAPLFSLDEIVISTGILAPPVPADPENEQALVDVVTECIPYLPDWPELGDVYGAPVLSLVESLQGGANALLTGHPGSGKTVALAQLASQIARQDPEVETLGTRVPVFLHAHEIIHTIPGEDTLDIVIGAVSAKVSTLTLPRLPGFLRAAFHGNQVLLLLDGLDELNVEDLAKTVGWVESLLKAYPRTRVVAAASIDHYGGLNRLGFVPLAMAAWSENQRMAFIEKWGELWTRFIEDQLGSERQQVDSMLLNGWLRTADVSLTPLELTLKTWAAYAGDSLGNEVPAIVEAYIRRMTTEVPNARPALEKLAYQMIFSQAFSLSIKEAENWVLEFEIPDLPEDAQDTGETEAPQEERKETTKQASTGKVISTFLVNGLLESRTGGTISFCHPVIGGYLAGCAIASGGIDPSIVSQPGWTGKWLALQFLACQKDITAIFHDLWDAQDPINRGTLVPARWLRLAPTKNLPWRMQVMRELANLLQKEFITRNLCARVITALGLSGDPGVATLFRQLLISPHASLRQMAVLGCGLAHDVKSVNDLADLTGDPTPGVGKAACLALVAIASKTALDTVAAVVLQGDEELRKAAAEALANHPEEGHPALIDGSTMPDLLIRRAVIFGLMRIKQPWVIETLEKIQIEDGQWVVRNAATQALEELRKPNPCIPRPSPALTELPWLIAFAGKLGAGLSPGKPALDMLLQALKNGDYYEKLGALNYLRLHGDKNTLVQIYHTYYGSLDTIREEAFNTLWHMAASGLELPSPVQIGLGG